MADFYDLQDQYRRQAQGRELTEALETARQLWDTFPDRRTSRGCSWPPLTRPWAT